MKKAVIVLCALLLLHPAAIQAQAPTQPRPAPQARNVIIFVADGLRYGSVTPATAPNLARLKAEGVDFANSHSLYPTVTTANASVIATGHYIGDTGNFGNQLWAGAALKSENGSSIGGMEDRAVQAELNARLEGNYLGEISLMARARAAGWSTAAVGKAGAIRIQDTTAPADGSQTLLVDDDMGKENGFPLPQWFRDEIGKAFVAPVMPATTYPNIEQQVNLTKAVTRIVLPRFKAAGKPFMITFWSRDPDITQHNARDSLGEPDPGINGRTALAAVRNADATLGEIRAALRAQGLDKTTDIFITADHGFITNIRASATSPSAKNGEIASGFVAADLAIALKLKRDGNMLGDDPAQPEVIVAANGGAVLIYLPAAGAAQRAREIAAFLATQDYVSGLFVNDRLGKVPGALAMSDVNLIGSARTPVPDMVVNMRTFAGPCGTLQCARGVYGNATGLGSHGSLSRAETRNFMAAVGPSFKAGFVNPAPISNADIAPTLAHLMGLDLPARGKLTGRVIAEALKGGAAAKVTRNTRISEPSAGGLRTYLNEQVVGGNRYFDAAGFPGRTVGLTVPTPAR